MKNLRAVGLLNPMRDKWQEPGGRRDDTCGHGLFRSWKVEVCKKKMKKKNAYKAAAVQIVLLIFVFYNWKPVFGHKLLGFSMWRGSGGLKGLILWQMGKHNHTCTYSHTPRRVSI